MVDIPDGVMAELIAGDSSSGSDDNCGGGSGGGGDGCLKALFYIFLVFIAIASAIALYSFGRDFLFEL